MSQRVLLLLTVGLSTLNPIFAQSRAQIAEAQAGFFETKIRPVLVKNCQMCHNAKARTASLDLSSAVGFLAGGQSGALINSDEPEKGRLLRAIRYEDNLKMPPMGKLKPEEIADLADWVKLGAPWPGAEVIAAAAAPANATLGFTLEQKSFWAFQAVRPVVPPVPNNLSWVRNEIDRFVLAKLEEKALKPAAPADRLTLLRRATYDLTGLPPSHEEIDNFLADQSPQAFEKVVDRLLASPRYGERWGRHWLDVARYADSTGNDEDHRYPYAWRYRDYVIDAFNSDLPYDRFVRQQLAGDLMPAAKPGDVNREGVVATGFLALGAKAIAQQDKKKMMYDIYDEQVDVVSRSFLGLTVACARCHNHKFDPILTKDYYSLVSMFASTRDFDDSELHVSKLLYVPLTPKDQYAAYRQQQIHVADVKLEIDVLAGRDEERYIRQQSARMAEYMIAARRVYQDGEAAEKVAADGHLDAPMLLKWVAYLKEGGKAHPQMAAWDAAPPPQQAELAGTFQARFTAQFADWTARMEQWREQVRKRGEEGNTPPPEKPSFDAAKDPLFYEMMFDRGPFAMNDKERQTILSPEVVAQVAALRTRLNGLKTHAMPEPDMACAVAEGQAVEQKVLIRGDYNNPAEDAPKAFPTILAKANDPPIRTTSGRLELADWMSRPANPLTARVMVNRIWGWHFGEGLVRTPDNFGKMGDRPSHPELLDFLAARFVQSGWSVKTLTRMIMLSNTYQMASDTDEKTLEADPENRLLSHFNRQRLDVEEIRDGMLAIGGTLDLTMGGTLQKGFGTDSENSADRLSMDPSKLTRRTVYLPLRRANLPTLLNLFDFGDATTVNGRRTLTNVAPQTLFMMNSEFGFAQAKRVAEAVLALPDASNAARLKEAYIRILNRLPEPVEMDAALTYINRFAAKYAGPAAGPNAWQSLCHILLASNEFVYLD